MTKSSPIAKNKNSSAHGWDNSIHDLRQFKLTPEEKKRRQLNQQRYQVQQILSPANDRMMENGQQQQQQKEQKNSSQKSPADWRSVLDTLRALNVQEVQRRLTHEDTDDIAEPASSSPPHQNMMLRVTPAVMQSGVQLAPQPTVPLHQEVASNHARLSTQLPMHRKSLNMPNSLSLKSSSSTTRGLLSSENVDPAKLRRWWTLVQEMLQVLDRPDLPDTNAGSNGATLIDNNVNDMDPRQPVDTLLRGQLALFNRWKDYLVQDALDKEHLLQICEQLSERNRTMERQLQEQNEMLTAVREQQTDSILLQEQTMDRLQDVLKEMEMQQRRMDAITKEMELERVMRGVRWSVNGGGHGGDLSSRPAPDESSSEYS